MKTANKIKKQAAKKAPHPNSRAALKLAGAECRRATLEKKQEGKAERLADRVGRFLWFQEEIKKQENITDMNNEDAREILVRYIARECAHLAATEKKLAIGQRKIQTNRLSQIRRDQEKSVMLLDSTGLEAPNFSNRKQLKEWLEWDGDFDSMQRLTSKFWKNQKFAEDITMAEVDAYVEHFVTRENNDEMNDEVRSTGEEEDEKTSEME